MAKELVADDSDWDFNLEDLSSLGNFESAEMAQISDVPVVEIQKPVQDFKPPIIKRKRVRKAITVDTVSRKLEKAMTLIHIALASCKEIIEELDDLPRPRKRKLNG